MSKTFLFTMALIFSVSVYAQQKDSVATDTLKVSTLDEVTIVGKKPFVQLLPDKTAINVDAAVSNAGATVLEVLEKSPGITTDRNGNISIKGRQGVLIMIDGKPSQVSGNELNILLSGMAAAQVDQIEIIDNPSSKYDAAGNAGIINIKTKKNRQKGFNGNVSSTIGRGRFTRNVNNITLNYYAGKLNVFSTLTVNRMQNFTDLYALRSYSPQDNRSVGAILEQPSYFKGLAPSQTLKTGVDYFVSKKTTLGIVTTGSLFSRRTTGDNTAIWKDVSGNVDSVIVTKSNNKDRLRSGAINLNMRHSFDAANELTADIDFLGYRINNNQNFNNTVQSTTGYEEGINGVLPSSIKIFTAKTDYTASIVKGVNWEAGWKSSHIKTNNGAEYFITNVDGRQPDYGKTNNFLYTETIHAIYTGLEKTTEKWTAQAGLRYENTRYHANQLGNAARKDSSFSRKYSGFFPTALASVHLDSHNVLSLSTGRRIDRPPFQQLNPFVFLINKYTYQSGNPFIVPQYTWNTELSHTYKDVLVTSLSYSRTRDYFSQIFLADSTGIIIYTEGNLDRMQNFGLSVSAQLSPLQWWSFSAQAAVNRKSIKGFVWKDLSASLTQANFNINNQFAFGKGWTGELSGFYTMKEQELQEIVDPTGQLIIGAAKQVLKNKGVIKIVLRDVFYTQAMKGFTIFEGSTEYFKITRDSRSFNISFTYRFGKQSKTANRNTGAEDEMRRVNTTG